MLDFKVWRGNVELDVKLSVELIEIVKFSSSSDNNHLFLLLRNQDLLHGNLTDESNVVYFKKLYHNVADIATSTAKMYFVSSDGRLFACALSDLTHLDEIKLCSDDGDISVKAISCCHASVKVILYIIDNLNRLWLREDDSLSAIEFVGEKAGRSYWKNETSHHFLLASGVDHCVILSGVSNSLNRICKQYCETSFTENHSIFRHHEPCPCLERDGKLEYNTGKGSISDTEFQTVSDVALPVSAKVEPIVCEDGSVKDGISKPKYHDEDKTTGNPDRICRTYALLDKSAVHIGRILMDTEIWAYGNNRRGQLGVGDQVPRNLGAVCINQLKCKGLKLLAAGDSHTVALAVDGKVWAWGDGSAGQLGNLKGISGNDANGSSSPRVIHWPISLGKIVDIAAGSRHTILLSDTGTVFTFGKIVHDSRSTTVDFNALSVGGELEAIQVFASGNFSACIFSSITLKKDLPSLPALIKESRELLTQTLTLNSDLFPLIPSSPLNKFKKEKGDIYFDEELDLVMQAVSEGHFRILYLLTLTVESLVWYERDLYLGAPLEIKYIAPIFHPDEYVKVYRAYLEAVCDLLAFEGFKNVQHYSAVSIQRIKSMFPGESDDRIISNALFKPLDHLKFYLHLLDTFPCKDNNESKVSADFAEKNIISQSVFPQGKTLSVPELSSVSHSINLDRGLLTSRSEMSSLYSGHTDKLDAGSLKGSSLHESTDSSSTACSHGVSIDDSVSRAKKIWKTLNVGEEWNIAHASAENTRQFWEDYSRGGIVVEKWQNRVDRNMNKKCSWQPRLHSQRLIRESKSSKPKEIPSLWVARPATFFSSAASASSSPSSSSPSFVLLTDAFLQISPYGQVSPHNLSTLWVELLRDSWNHDQTQPIPQNALQLTMPEDSVTLVASNAEERMKWLKALQSAIMVCLGKESPALLKNSTGIPPVSRNASYLFLRHPVYKEAIYTGGWLFGRPNGKGVMEWNDGKKIEGIFKDGLVNGHARHILPNVGTYNGQWKDGHYHGYGIMKYTNGAVYEGEWREGQPEGHGIRKEGHFLSSVASVYVGDWVAGAKHGYGVMDDILTGEKYLGLWEKGEKHGNGLIVSLDGVYHEGSFVRGTISGYGVMVFEEGTHYEGELRGTGIFGGRGKLTLAPGGHSLEGMLCGSWDNVNGVKISNGTFCFNRGPTSPVDNPSLTPAPSTPSSFGKLCVPPHKKWRSLFHQCREELGLKAEEEDEIAVSGSNVSNIENLEKSRNLVDVQKVWENVAIAITRSQIRLKQKLQQQPYEKGSGKDQPGVNLKAGDDGLVTIPNFGRKTLDRKTYIEIQKYLMKATESSHHPLGRLVASMTSAFTATYGGVRVHPLLLPHAVSELSSLTIRLYAICRLLFPALPPHGHEVILYTPIDSDLKSINSEDTQEEEILGDGIVEAVEDLEEDEQEEEVVTAAGLLHPILLPRVHSSLFVLYALHNKREDDAYWLRLRKLNSHDNLSLMAFLDVNRKFWVCASPESEYQETERKSSFSSVSLPSTPTKVHGHAFVDAVETLQQLKTKFCPLEKLEVIHNTFERMACTIQRVMGSQFMLGMDDLFPTFHFVVVRAQILQLGSEIHFVEDFMESHLRNGELGMMFTTLKACYYQILQEKSN